MTWVIRIACRCCLDFNGLFSFWRIQLGVVKKMKYIYWLMLMVVFSAACKQQETDTTQAPAKVRLVKRVPGADTLADERGIDAEYDIPSAKDGIELMWYENSRKSELSQYRIYRSIDPQGRVSYKFLASVQLNQPSQIDTVYIDTQDLETNVRYYYYITAVDKKNRESAPSDTLSYRLIEMVNKLSLNGNSTEVTQTKMNFEWWIADPSQMPDQYILRIENYLNKDFHPLAYIEIINPVNYEIPQSKILSGEWLKNTFLSGSYRWRVDCAVADKDSVNNYYSGSGSESKWAPFTVQWSN